MVVISVPAARAIHAFRAKIMVENMMPNRTGLMHISPEEGASQLRCAAEDFHGHPNILQDSLEVEYTFATTTIRSHSVDTLPNALR